MDRTVKEPKVEVEEPRIDIAEPWVYGPGRSAGAVRDDVRAALLRDAYRRGFRLRPTELRRYWPQGNW